MNQTETLKREPTFSFSELRKKVIDPDLGEKKSFGFEKPRTNLSLEQTINNYLKTPEEMDAEFSLELNADIIMFKEHIGIFDTYGRIVKNKDGNNTYNPDSTPSGFMEENY